MAWAPISTSASRCSVRASRASSGRHCALGVLGAERYGLPQNEQASVLDRRPATAGEAAGADPSLVQSAPSRAGARRGAGAAALDLDGLDELFRAVGLGGV